jgi:hypothetical protein
MAADEGIPDDGFDRLWTWSEVKDWRNWERVRRARRRPPSRRQLIGLWVTFVVLLGVPIILTATSPHLGVIGLLFFVAAGPGITLLYYGLASLSRRRRHSKLFDQDHD